MSSIQHIPSASYSPEQQEINTKIKEVKNLQEELKQLNVSIPEAVTAYQKAIAPIAEKIRLLQKEKIIALDIYVHEIKFSKRELQEIDTYMTGEIEQWLYENGSDSELEDLFITYAHMSFEAYTEQFRKEEDTFSFQNQVTDEEPSSESKKKTAAERMAEKEKVIQEQHRKKSIRAIYIDLIKAFHPDTEQDAGKKAEKEEISKKITEAYGKNDLYALLNLETKFLEQQTNRLNGMKAETVKSYAAMLDNQIKELKQSIRDFKNQHDTIFFEMCKPNAKPEKYLRKVKKELQEGVQILSRQIMILQHVDPGIKSDLLFEMERQNSRRR
ncbi:molecular chaperone DnaJ [Cytophaga hutchinsonii]|uniref:DnaJ domain protein n=1 Tax=Cytophaga hutchinsonii (strain ATCC 33406 / DSM 1761 / CIP 103989 / NBRC 15051 / NCIMB 9469 / D465) TaxID=269798 RepID=A0A6N4SQS4_CYTH3|nr:molecular chaperone DnaJ [Cytophaga hutchinsonii]ABG58677.1 DnaJ domain protein [Cytophaga hutchinsonii ATCC 33406]SFX59429.1 hypothetical protein SAMN04487930_10671 [Cytophaga hutchinsonii ATCC 33406]